MVRFFWNIYMHCDEEKLPTIVSVDSQKLKIVN